MRNSKIKLAITTIFLAGTISTFSVFAHEGEGMMSSDGMQGMGGMMGMMSDMSPEDRKAMTDACMKMMQSQGSDHMDSGKKAKDAEAS
ncbi:hypothetical protein [Marinobacter sp. AC-23]|uniref:hypothetical protein n=1 Tax=Marinobacter sp. AC-23 TaxID=1879031 RepID=UPI0008DE136E|nr:hypothetical protein [Marinobacter sp. AC-23]OHY81477.1 hypothetical protein BCA33_11340 [Marinobacter sp. AC-23]